MGREFFKCFHDYRKKCEKLSDQEIGRLFRALMEYSEFGTTQELAGRESIAFDFIAEDIDRDRAAYEQKCKVNAENGSKGGKRMVANATERKRIEAKSSESDKIKDIRTIKTDTNVSAKRFTPPTLQEVEAYIAEKGLSVDGKKFFAYYDTPNANGEKWIDSKGQKVKNWKQKLLTWASHDGKEKPKGDYGFGNYQQKVVHMDELKNLI